MKTKVVRDSILENSRFSDSLADVRVIKGRTADFSGNFEEMKFDKSAIIRYLKKREIKLYSHQQDTIEEILSGHDVILSTPTASGKTLAFFLPFLQMRVNNPNATALAIYPAKALTRDQLIAAKEISDTASVDLVPAIYDGDVPSSARPGIREKAGLVLTNPYELHQILSWHRQWGRFWKSLKYVIIDEAHQFRGVFGSHVALLLRRLQRICAYYGSNPIFLLSSATIANPSSFAKSLTGKTHVIVDRNGAPSGDRTMILYNPFHSPVNPRSPFSEAALLLAVFVESGLQTLCFTTSRKMAELVANYARDRLKIVAPACNVVSYRAGYLPEERKKIESEIKSGIIRGVVSTNALELGIDIGSLDAVIITGYPGTMMSVWQQTGRAGRKAASSLAIIIAFNSPLDQYFMKNPSVFFDRPHEHAFVNLTNPYILSGEILCASAELPLVPSDKQWFGDCLDLHIKNLENEHLISKTPRGYVYSGLKRATELVSISNISGSWVLESGSHVLETLSYDQACREAHVGAVVLHQGVTYLVSRWDNENHRILADREDVPYYTRVDHSVNVKIISEKTSRPCGGGVLYLGDVEVTETYNQYRKIQDNITIGYEKLDIPPVSYQTISLWWFINESIIDDIIEKKRDPAGSLHGAEHSLIAMMPYYLLCDRKDIGGLSTVLSGETGGPVIFIYDGYEGGIGLAETSFELFEKIGKSSFDLVDQCKCVEGCPACIHSPKCGNDNQPLDKSGTKIVLSVFMGED